MQITYENTRFRILPCDFVEDRRCCQSHSSPGVRTFFFVWLRQCTNLEIDYPPAPGPFLQYLRNEKSLKDIYCKHIKSRVMLGYQNYLLEFLLELFY